MQGHTHEAPVAITMATNIKSLTTAVWNWVTIIAHNIARIDLRIQQIY